MKQLGLFLFICCCISSTSTVPQCSRALSRVVRRLIQQELQPLLTQLKADWPSECPLYSERDKYEDQESHKVEESASRYVCDYCGKAFYEERFLDLHFENRHAKHIGKGPDVVCLADYCDVFRCDVILGKNQPKYWDMAMCQDSDLKRAQKTCKDLIKVCVPDLPDRADKTTLRVKLENALCSYLSCDNYWELPVSELTPVGSATYIIATVILMFALMLYYIVMYAHFYTDEPVFEAQRRRRRRSYDEQPTAPLAQDMRHRAYQFR